MRFGGLDSALAIVFQPLRGQRVFGLLTVRSRLGIAPLVAASVLLLDPRTVVLLASAFLSCMAFARHRRFLKLIAAFVTKAVTGWGVLCGFRIGVFGKISVGGNARKRSLVQKTGVTSRSLVGPRVASAFSIVRSITGCLGFSLMYLS